MPQMKRRNFLKLCCAAVVAPSLPVSAPVVQERVLTEGMLLREHLKIRREYAIRALVHDVEASAVLFNSGPHSLGDMVMTDNNLYIWVRAGEDIRWREVRQ